MVIFIADDLYKGTRVIVVFDAHMVKGSMEKHECYGGVEVVFTRENETADSYIERLTDEVGRLYDILVATSDWLEQQVVLGRGLPGYQQESCIMKQ